MQKPPIYKILEALEQHNKGYKQMGNGQYMASCPTRDDKSWSLSIAVKADGTVLLNDFAGKATAQEIVAALGLTLKDLYPDNRLKPKQLNINQPDAIYSYRDAQGVEISQVCRFEFTNKEGLPDKTFRQRHHDGAKWIWSAPKNTPLYRLPDVRAADPHLWVFVPEGEKDVDRLYQAALIATTNMGGAARAWPDDYCHELQGRKVALVADNDRSGKKRVETLANQLSEYASKVVILNPDDLRIKHIVGGDVSDTLELSLISGPDLVQMANNKKPYQPQPVQPHRKTWYSRDELLNTAFPDPVWLVKNMLPEQSLAIMAGRPKIGKSWLTLQLSNAIADGAKFLDQDTTQGKVLYIALEDNPRRIKNRLIMQGMQAWATGLDFAFAWPDLLAENGIDQLHEVITKDDYCLVTFDTFGRSVSVNPDDIKGITRVLGQLQEIAFDTMTTILLIDHHRKSFGGVDDVIDAVVDATAKTAVVDLIMGLYRPQRETIGMLKATGRDIEDTDVTIKFNGAIGTWEYMGDTDDVASNSAEEAIMEAIEFLSDKATGQGIIDYLELSKGYVYQTLKRLVDEGKIETAGHGRPYTLKSNQPTQLGL